MSYQVTTYPIVPESSISQSAYRLKIVVASETLDPSVFVYQKAEANDSRGDGWFTCVANAAQIAEYPDKSEHVAGGGVVQSPFYRDAQLDLLGRHPQDLMDLSDQIIDRIRMLKTSLTLLDSPLQDATVITI